MKIAFFGRHKGKNFFQNCEKNNSINYENFLRSPPDGGDGRFAGPRESEVLTPQERFWTGFTVHGRARQKYRRMAGHRPERARHGRTRQALLRSRKATVQIKGGTKQPKRSGQPGESETTRRIRTAEAPGEGQQGGGRAGKRPRQAEWSGGRSTGKGTAGDERNGKYKTDRTGQGKQAGRERAPTAETGEMIPTARLPERSGQQEQHKQPERPNRRAAAPFSKDFLSDFKTEILSEK